MVSIYFCCHVPWLHYIVMSEERFPIKQVSWIRHASTIFSAVWLVTESKHICYTKLLYHGYKIYFSELSQTIVPSLRWYLSETRVWGSGMKSLEAHHVITFLVFKMSQFFHFHFCFCSTYWKTNIATSLKRIKTEMESNDESRDAPSV